jgi:hypothetical protein
MSQLLFRMEEDNLAGSFDIITSSELLDFSVMALRN